MIQLSSLTKAFGEQVLFEKVTWQISERDRIGLCGPNGAGKTTLLRMLADLEMADSGKIIKPSGLTIGYLPQSGLTHTGRTLDDEVKTAFKSLLSMKEEMRKLELRLETSVAESPDHDHLLTRYSDLQDSFHDQDGYSIDLKIATILCGLGFNKKEFSRRTETFSGGWQMRIALAKILLSQPKLILLDEPTNHLDLEARNWLEGFLVQYPEPVIVVSHDRFFLDTVVTHITEVGQKTLTNYTGTYSNYTVEREKRLSQLRELKRRQEEEIARIQVFINRFRYQATKASQVQSRLKMLKKIKPLEVPSERKRVHFSFPPCTNSGRLVLDLREACKSYSNNPVFFNARVSVERGDRIALIGQNGSGKSTLMRMLAGVELPDSGTRSEGYNVVTQYFAQDQAAQLDSTLTVYETLETGSPDQMIPTIRHILGGFLFSGDDIHKRVSVLSGGERTRLAIARMLLRPSNTLLLDEPTNHLDIDSTNVLLDALTDFSGTLVFVSHDRYFVERLATKIIEIGHGKASLYPGTYKEFCWARSQSEKNQTDASNQSQHNQRQKIRAIQPNRKKQTDDRKRKREITIRNSRIEKLEREIAELENAIKNLEASMAEPGFYDDQLAAGQLIDHHQTLMWKVRNLMEKWEELQNRNT